MFQPKIVRRLCMAAIVVSVLALLLSGIAIMAEPGHVLSFCMGIISWGLMLWASVLAYEMSKYPLTENDFTKTGWYAVAIIVMFVLFLTIGLMFGIVVAIFVVYRLSKLKKHYNSVTVDDRLSRTGR